MNFKFAVIAMVVVMIQLVVLFCTDGLHDKSGGGSGKLPEDVKDQQ